MAFARDKIGFPKGTLALKLFFQKASIDQIFDRSSSLAFQLVFSLVPMFALAYSVFAWLGGFDKLRQETSQWLLQYLAPSVSQQVGDYLASIEQRVSPQAVGAFGVLGFLYAGFMMIGKAEESLNAIWGITRSRSFRERTLVYLGVLILAPIALGVSLALSSYLSSVVTTGLHFVFDPGSVPGRIGVFILALLPTMITSLFLAFSYSTLPYTRIDPGAALKSGFAAGIVLDALKYGYTLYASYALGNSVYGSLAILPILFLWISLSSLIYLLGAELCYFLDQKRAGVVHVEAPEATLSVRMLVDILRAFDQYRTTMGARAQVEPLSVRTLLRELDWDLSVVNRHVQYLRGQRLLRPARGQILGDESFAPVFDDLEQAVESVVQKMNQVKYERWALDEPRPIGAKRKHGSEISP